MSLPLLIPDLLRRFNDNAAQYRDPAYNETEARREFIDPFFKALGWDVDNTQSYSEKYKEVVHEARVTVGGRVKAPDYAFRVGGRPVFFVEAKRPGVPLHAGREADEAAFQVRRYAWSAKLPVSVLTNFAEFALYDCRSKPARSDGAGVGRVLYIPCADYPARWDELTRMLSPEAIRKGALDRYVESEKATRGTLAVDAAFLAEIETWRDALARNFALRNAGLTVRRLNFAVQKTIDRIIFLRIAEDRGFEPYHRLGDLAQGKEVYRALGEVFRQADNRYNAGLFYFRQETGREEDFDDFTLNLTLDDKVLKDILTGLYYPDSPYAFDALPADILGQVYEQFLGKIIRLTTGGRAKVEEKPEVKKAGGVYYTPTYIVDYIVEHTVGPLLTGKTWREARGLDARGVQRYAPLRVLDPACGSGTFLLQAYQYLLDWYLEQYTAEDPKPVRFLKPDRFGWRLTTEARKDILLTHLYGVDIDPQAVEVTKLSLLLKVLEGEDEQSLGQQLTMSLGKQERVLPDLGQNIRCGNSLIGSDFYQGQQLGLGLLDEEEVYRINAFDWDAPEGFGKAMAAGGFDAVIGNPPYGIPFDQRELGYIVNKLPQAEKFPDSYCLFMIKGMQLLKQGGYLSYIVPNTFCDLESCDQFRKWFLEKFYLKKIWQSGWAFKSAIVDTVVFVMLKESPNTNSLVSINLNEREFTRPITQFQSHLLFKIDYRNSAEDISILQKLQSPTILPLCDTATVNAGVKMYERGKGQPPQTAEMLKTRPYSKKGTCPEGWRPLYRGQHVERYNLKTTQEFVNYGPWIAAPRNTELFESPKILMRRTDDHLMACLEEVDAICVNSCHVIKLKSSFSKISHTYLLGLLNSNLLQRVFELQNPQMINKVFAEIKVIYVQRLPIRTIDFSNPADVARHDRMIALVKRMLDLHRKLAAAQLSQEKRLLQQQIDVTDKAIDALVYELYALTPEEIAIVEGG